MNGMQPPEPSNRLLALFLAVLQAQNERFSEGQAPSPLHSEEFRKLTDRGKHPAIERSFERSTGSFERSMALCSATIDAARRSSAAAIEQAKLASRSDDVNLAWVSAPRRRAPGAFEQLVRRVPGVAERIVRLRLLGPRGRSLQQLHEYFMHELIRCGEVSIDEYPFTTKSGGYRAFCNWMSRELRSRS